MKKVADLENQVEQETSEAMTEEVQEETPPAKAHPTGEPLAQAQEKEV